MFKEEEYRKLSKEEKVRYVKKLRKIEGREDLLYFAKEILGYKDVEEGVHGKLGKVLSDEKKRKLVLLPRGSFKSTIGTQAYPIWRFLKNEDIRILIDSEVLDNSQRFLGIIKQHLRTGSFIELYGELISGEHRETAREFTLRTRKNPRLKEPTVFATGIGTVNIGQHYELIICDDLHSEKNVSTQEQIDKVVAHYRLLLSLLEPGGEMVIIGTRWHFDDLYDFLLEEEVKAEGSQWEVYTEKAIRDDGSLYFPKRLTKGFLREQRLAMGAYLYSCQYQNSPVDSETQTFKRKFFKYWGGSGDIFPTNEAGKNLLLNVYILIDRAFSSRASADYTGCACVGVSSSGAWYVLEAERHKCGLNELEDLIFRWIRKYGEGRIRYVGVETINWEEIEKHFRDAMKFRKKFFNLVRLAPESKTSKQRRIEAALEPLYTNGMVYHRKRMVELEDELMRFPASGHDDIIDALAYAKQVSTAPVAEEQEIFVGGYEPSGFFGRSGY